LTLVTKTKRGRERILAVLLTAMLMLSCLPAGMAFGDETAPAAPAISPNGGSIDASATVAIEATLTVSQAVYYTITDGDADAVLPEIGSEDTYAYAAPFNVSPAPGAYTVNAAVYDAGTGLWSSVATAVFSITAAPGVITDEATAITDSSAVLNGSIFSDYGYEITDYGFVWGTNSDSLTNKLAVGTTVYQDAFSANLDELTAGTAYYFKAYATNEKGTSYGVVKSFSTSSPTPPATGAFSDVSPSHWAYDVITQMSTAGYVYGYPDGTFKPDNTITRAEFVTIINRVLDLQPYSPAAPSFTDVASDAWYSSSVESAVYAGIIQGYGAGIFDPGRTITREELATILVNALGKKDEAAASISESTAFTDDAGISAWARGNIVVAVKYRLLNGYPDGSFQPQANATRAETSALISNFLTAKGGAASVSQ
jgi:hypothetical protein